VAGRAGGEGEAIVACSWVDLSSTGSAKGRKQWRSASGPHLLDVGRSLHQGGSYLSGGACILRGDGKLIVFTGRGGGRPLGEPARESPKKNLGCGPIAGPVRHGEPGLHQACHKWGDVRGTAMLAAIG